MKSDWVLDKTSIYTNKTLKPHLLFLELFRKKKANRRQKREFQQNSMCLEQQIYTSPDNYTQALLVMLETIRGSGLNQTLLVLYGMVWYGMVWYAAPGSVRVCSMGIMPHMETLKGG